MIIFKKLPDPDNAYDHSTIIIKTEAETLSDIVQDFEDFLKGCGFDFKGHLDFVVEELEDDSHE